MVRVRRGLVIFVRGMAAFILFAFFAQAASAATPAEIFVQQSVDRGVAILSDKALSGGQRRARMEELLANVMSTHRLALFCLGKAAATAAPADVDAFAAAFETFTMARYTSLLGYYGGQSLKVTGSTERSATDHVVTAVLVSPGGMIDPDPVTVLFRVLNEGDKYGVVDASIAGVWFGMAQRDDIQGFLAANNNDVPKLTARMTQMTASLKTAVTE
jgi:phospholipid transport system substrate-binding protein